MTETVVKNGMNIILVVFDSLRKDCVGAYGSPPWGKVHTPNLDAFARESVRMTHVYPESLPTLPTRRALYTGRRVYPFHNGDFRLKGDFVGAPGWGPIPEDQPTVAEMLSAAGYRTGLVSDVYHQFKPSKNFWRGFQQWVFLRGQEIDPGRSGPHLTAAELDYWLPPEIRQLRANAVPFTEQCILNMRDRTREEDYFAPRVLKEAALWLEQNQDAQKLFLVVESFDPHEPWLVPPHYRRLYAPDGGREQVISTYSDVSTLDPALLARTQANYSAEVTMCDRWFGFFMEAVRVLGMLDNTMIIVTTDHGHSIGDGHYMGKRGYPSHPSVCDVPLLVRFPGAQHAGKTSDMLLQHTDMAAAILDAAGVEPPPLDGASFLNGAVTGKPGLRQHITVGWGSHVTVIDKRWWLNCKIDGTGVILHDLKSDDPFAANVAGENPDTVNKLFGLAVQDTRGGFPDWLMTIAKTQADAPGCSDLVARP